MTQPLSDEYLNKLDLIAQGKSPYGDIATWAVIESALPTLISEIRRYREGLRLYAGPNFYTGKDGRLYEYQKDGPDLPIGERARQLLGGNDAA